MQRQCEFVTLGAALPQRPRCVTPLKPTFYVPKLHGAGRLYAVATAKFEAKAGKEWEEVLNFERELLNPALYKRETTSPTRCAVPLPPQPPLAWHVLPLPQPAYAAAAADECTDPDYEPDEIASLQYASETDYREWEQSDDSPPPSYAASVVPSPQRPKYSFATIKIEPELDDDEEYKFDVRGTPHPNYGGRPISAHIKEFYVDLEDKKPLSAVKVNAPPLLRPKVDPDRPRARYERFREKSFVCDYCDHWFTLKQNVQTHIFNYHLGICLEQKRRGKRFQCTKCLQVFRTLLQAQRHESRAHKEASAKKVAHKCELCEKTYKTPSQLREHVSIAHLNERPYECDECGAKFGRQGGLRRHKVFVHTERTFDCPYEGCTHPGYKCSKALAAHIRSVHTKDRPYKCEICGKAFVRRNDLKMHVATHDNTSSFSCGKCGQSFRRVVTLKKHERTCMGARRDDARVTQAIIKREEPDDAEEEAMAADAEQPRRSKRRKTTVYAEC